MHSSEIAVAIFGCMGKHVHVLVRYVTHVMIEVSEIVIAINLFIGRWFVKLVACVQGYGIKYVHYFILRKRFKPNKKDVYVHVALCIC